MDAFLCMTIILQVLLSLAFSLSDQLRLSALHNFHLLSSLHNLHLVLFFHSQGFLFKIDDSLSFYLCSLMIKHYTSEAGVSIWQTTMHDS